MQLPLKVTSSSLYRFDLLRSVNRTLFRRGVEGLFCTLTFAAFDFASRWMRIANSGLPYPLRYRAATRRCEVIDLGGLPLGAFDDSTYEERSIPLESGDAFVFHTDGVTEAHNGREAYGQARLIRLVEEHGHLPSLGDKVIEDLEQRFMGDVVAADDVTLLVVRIL